jgi:hypothetical protein
MAAGIATTVLLTKPDWSFGQTAANESSENVVGSRHMSATVASAGFLNDVTTRT